MKFELRLLGFELNSNFVYVLVLLDQKLCKISLVRYSQHLA